jgi:hypothetical protein
MASGIGGTTVQRPRKVAGYFQDEGQYLGPDKEAFVLGEDPNYAKNFAGQANARADIASAEQNFVRGAAGNAAASANRNQLAAQSRVSPAATQIGQSARTGAAQGNLAERLRTFAEAPEGPSAAQATLRQGTNQALNSQLAMARSGGGFGESASSLGRAAGAAAGIQAGAANEAARIRADETARHRDRSLSAFQASGDVLGAQRAGTMAEGDAELAAQGQRDAAALGYAAEQRAALGLESDASERGYRANLDAQALGLDAEQAALAGRDRYQQTVSDLYQAELVDAAEHRKQDRQRDKDWVEGATGAISAIGGAFGLSDVRAKKNVTRLSDAGEYGDPSGDYYALADQNFSMRERRDARARASADAGERADNQKRWGMISKGLSMMSDEHSKERIRELESINDEYKALFDGPPATEGTPKRDAPDFERIGTYEYEYKDPERHGRGRYVGPMAQELEHIPGVVEETREGKAVNAPRLTMANTSELAAQRRELERLKAEFDALYDGPAATEGMR